MHRHNDYHHCDCRRCPLGNHRPHYRRRLRQDTSQVYYATICINSKQIGVYICPVPVVYLSVKQINKLGVCWNLVIHLIVISVNA